MSNSNMVTYYDRYVEAWNEYDPEAVMAQFAEGGTLDDPATDGTLTAKKSGSVSKKPPRRSSTTILRRDDVR